MIQPSPAINPTSAISERTPDGVITVRAAVPSTAAENAAASQRFRACGIDNNLPARGRHPRPSDVAES